MRTLSAHLYELNPANPHDRQQLLDEQRRLEMKLAHTQRLIDTESFNQGYRHAQRIIDRRDLIDAQLNELHGLIHSIDFSGIERCRTPRCQNTAGPAYTHSGYCPSCLIHAVNGTQPNHDATAPLPAVVGSPWGADRERTTMNIEDAVEAILARVASGELTEEQGRKLALEAATAAGLGQIPSDVVEPPKPDPRKAAPIQKTERQLLVDALTRTGATRTEALEASLVTDPASAKAIIDTERERQQARADAEAAGLYEASPEGLRERGERLAAERAEKERLIAPARELLREKGFSDADIDAVARSTDDLLVMAGLQEAPPPPRRESRSRMIRDYDPPSADELHANLVAAGEIKEGGESSE